mmetsp:Transcript_40675/g.66006  ORF Transcript_40675/g.66006 Transcript_40675/m.66006 type:complete len:805 (+) Transcript_40675:61-2475(+)
MSVASTVQWEQNAVLSETLTDILAKLEAEVSERPLPDELRNADRKDELSGHSLVPPASIRMSLSGLRGLDTVQQFYSWFSEIEEKVESEKEDKYRSYMDTLLDYSSCCDRLMAELENALNFLNELESDYALVSTKTTALHDACESLVRDKNRLVFLAENVRTKLAYFDEVDTIGKQLSGNNPNISVLSDSFIPFLTRLDQCISYVSENPQYKDSDPYNVRFQQLQSRALTIIRNYTVGSLRTITSQIQSLVKDGSNVHDSTETSLLYVKYRAVAPPLKALMEELNKRASKKEYGSLLSECCSTYVQCRMQLLGVVIRAQYALLAKDHDLAALTRAGSAYLARICQQEHQLFQYYFPPSPSTDDAVRGLIESVSVILYDNLRPLLVRQAELDSLCEVIEILKSEVFDDQRRGEWVHAFQPILARLLQDSQERVIYRVQTYIRDEIRSFVPTPADLNYPEKLQELVAQRNRGGGLDEAGAGTGTGSVSQQSLSSPKTEAGLPPGQEPANVAGRSAVLPNIRTLYASWYPTLERTLMTLSKLYRSLDIAVFEGIAHEMVSVCTATFLSAAKTITKNKGMIDGHLFLIKHLLILREQITPFEINFSMIEKTLDFSNMKDALSRLVRAGPQGLLALGSHNALLAFVTQAPPRIMETQADSKKDLENELKSACESFILHVTKMAIEPLLSYLTKVSAFVSVRNARGESTHSPLYASIRDQTFAHPDRLKEILQSVEDALTNTLPPLMLKMALYLNNPATRSILFKPIKTNVMEALTQLHRVLEAEYSIDDRKLIGASSVDNISRRLEQIG